MWQTITPKSLAIAASAALLSIVIYNAWAPPDATFDYLVVGGGTAGTTIGTRLAQHGFQVAIIEAGSYYEIKRPIAKIPGAATLGVGASIDTATDIDWRFIVRGEPGTDYRDIHYPRGKCLGGSYECPRVQCPDVNILTSDILDLQ